MVHRLLPAPFYAAHSAVCLLLALVNLRWRKFQLAAFAALSLAARCAAPPTHRERVRECRVVVGLASGGRGSTLRHMDPIGARRFQLFDTLLGRFTPGKFLDLGAAHGKFSLRAADTGWSVTAVDARNDRFPADSRVHWITSDQGV
jgi:hypothetical protein